MRGLKRGILKLRARYATRNLTDPAPKRHTLARGLAVLRRVHILRTVGADRTQRATLLVALATNHPDHDQGRHFWSRPAFCGRCQLATDSQNSIRQYTTRLVLVSIYPLGFPGGSGKGRSSSCNQDSIDLRYRE